MCHSLTVVDVVDFYVDVVSNEMVSIAAEFCSNNVNDQGRILEFKILFQTLFGVA